MIKNHILNSFTVALNFFTCYKNSCKIFLLNMGLLSSPPLECQLPKVRNLFLLTAVPQGLEQWLVQRRHLINTYWVNMSLLVMEWAQPQAPLHNLHHFSPESKSAAGFRRAPPHLFNPFPYSALGCEGSSTSGPGQRDTVHLQNVEDVQVQHSQCQHPSNFKTSQWCQLYDYNYGHTTQ